MAWTERTLVPDLESTHVMEGYEEFEDICDKCEKLDGLTEEEAEEVCECCDACIPIVTDRYFVKEVTKTMMTCCGIPIGSPYQVGEERIVGEVRFNEEKTEE